MRVGVVLAVCLALFPAALVAQSTDLRRLTLRSDVLGWEAVGRVDMGREGFCTGTLIADDLVLTAAHCLFDSKSGNRVDPRDLVFRAGLRDGVSIAERRGLRAVVPDRYDYRSGDKLTRIRNDLALLQLEAPITTAEADPFRTDVLAAESSSVSVVSYARGRSEAASRQRQCRIVARSDGLVAFDCDVTFGSSGAPVFQEREGRLRIVSVISSVSESRSGPLSLGMELPGVLGDLKSALRSGRGVWPESETAPATRRLKVGDDQGEGGNAIRFLRP